jgi:hypothetical protein
MPAGSAIGHWRYVFRNGASGELLAQWSGECELPVAYAVNGNAISGFGAGGAAVESQALGLAIDGSPIVQFPATACGTGSGKSGVYIRNGSEWRRLTTSTSVRYFRTDTPGTGQSGTQSETVRCEDMPHLWSGAEDVAYDPQSGIVHMIWPDGAAADVRDTEPECAAQPGLREQLDGYREGAIASERASCRDLQYLVDAVRAERRSHGQSTSGSVPVTDAAQAAAARRTGTDVDAAIAKRHVGSRLINLDEADKSLAQCPP